MLAFLFIVAALCPLHHAALDIGLMSEGLLTPKFPNALILTYPNCTTYGAKNAALIFQESTITNANTTQPFVVPMCNETKFGYLLKDLKNGTTYSMQYKIDDVTSKILNETTADETDLRQINDGLPARSGAMVVITVLLVLAMLGLLVGIICICLVIH